MTRSKWMSLLLAAAMLLTLLPGCGGDQGGTGRDGRETVTIALWSDQLTEQYTSYLQDAFPDVDFQFYTATNSTDFYRFKAEQGALPDILTVRRFALSDVADWKEELLDLSDTELANTFPQAYLRSYTYSDGTVNWLPACAEVDSLVINQKLLADNGLSLPASYSEFLELCRTLREMGIRPFLSNFTADYTCMELLQGFSASQLSSQAGREWRQQYESGQTSQLSEEVWLPVFQRMAEVIDAAGITADDLERDHPEVLAAFQSGELAMMRGTGNETAIRDSKNGEHILMPYFGESEEDSWYLTYPAFQLAASAKGTEREERKELILRIMGAMLNQSGQEHIASGRNMIPYNRDVALELSEELENLQPYIDSNQLYIRLASSDMFSISLPVVRGMISGEYPDARAAFDAFNAAMNIPAGDTEPVYPLDTSYPYAFDPDHGNQAVSAVMNSLREEVGTQLALGQTSDVSGDIVAGSYTQAQLRFLTTSESRSVLLCEVTGDQLYRYISAALDARDVRCAVRSDSELFVSSGFAMELRRDGEGYTLERLTIDGREISREERYTLAIVGYEAFHKAALEAAGVTAYDKAESSFKQIIIDRLTGGRQLAAPADYITLN